MDEVLGYENYFIKEVNEVLKNEYPDMDTEKFNYILTFFKFTDDGFIIYHLVLFDKFPDIVEVHKSIEELKNEFGFNQELLDKLQYIIVPKTKENL